MFKYKTKGTCSTQINLVIRDGLIENVEFCGGCNGNLQGITRLVIGRKAEDVVKMLDGIKCGHKETSCPDQLAKAIKEAIAKK